MTEIEQFLKDPSDIDKGIMLYNQFGRYANLKRVFAKQRQKMLPKLLYELNKIKHLGKQVPQKVASNTNVIARAQPVANSQQHTKKVKQPVNKEQEKQIQITIKSGDKALVSANSPLKDLNSQRANLYKRADFLFIAKLNEINSKNERYEAAKELHEIYTKKLPPINKKIDQILNGEVEEEKEEVITIKKPKPSKPVNKYDVAGTKDRAALVQMLNNVRVNISRNKKHPKRLEKWLKIEKAINEKLKNGKA